MLKKRPINSSILSCKSNRYSLFSFRTLKVARLAYAFLILSGMKICLAISRKDLVVLSFWERASSSSSVTRRNEFQEVSSNIPPFTHSTLYSVLELLPDILLICLLKLGWILLPSDGFLSLHIICTNLFPVPPGRCACTTSGASQSCWFLKKQALLNARLTPARCSCNSRDR